MSLGPEFLRFHDDILRKAEKRTLEIMAGGSSSSAGRIVDVPIVLGATGTPLAVGDHVFLRLGLGGPATVISWSLAATVGGVATASTVQLDVLVGATLATAASIVDSHPPALAAASEAHEQFPTGWTTSIPDPSWLRVSVTSADGTVELVGLTLRMQVG
jgi:hypothetical protein